jgi:hypothetical protein
MRPNYGSLRSLVEKWMSPSVGLTLQVSRCGYSDPHRRRFVRVRTECSTGMLEVAFFRHDDGCWHVFPQARTRPTMYANWPGLFSYPVRTSTNAMHFEAHAKEEQ